MMEQFFARFQTGFENFNFFLTSCKCLSRNFAGTGNEIFVVHGKSPLCERKICSEFCSPLPPNQVLYAQRVLAFGDVKMGKNVRNRDWQDRFVPVTDKQVTDNESRASGYLLLWFLSQPSVWLMPGVVDVWDSELKGLQLLLWMLQCRICPSFSQTWYSPFEMNCPDLYQTRPAHLD